MRVRFYYRFARRMGNQFLTMLDEGNWARRVRKTKTDKDIPHPWVTYNPKPTGNSAFVRAEWAQEQKPAAIRQKTRVSQ